MDDIVGAVVSAYRWLADYLLQTTGFALSQRAFLLLPFFVPVIISAVGRSILTTAAICGFGWVGASFVPAMAFSSQSVILYAVLLVASACASVNAVQARRRLVSARSRCEVLTHALKDANGSLDRERFWRRVNGDHREVIPDDDLRVLWERLESAVKRGTEMTGLSRR
jgi:hypothetical protein